MGIRLLSVQSLRYVIKVCEGRLSYESCKAFSGLYWNVGGRGGMVLFYFMKLMSVVCACVA